MHVDSISNLNREAVLDFEQLVDRASQVMQIPAVLFQVLECAADPDSEIEKLVDLISADPVFSAQIVRLANCPVFYRGYDVDSLQQAVVRIGRVEIHALCAVFICSGETRKLNNSVIRISDFLFQSLFSAHLAKGLASQKGVEGSIAFTAALFQGLGIMVMIDQEPEEMARLMVMALDMDKLLPSVIKKEHGIDCYALSAAIAERWSLPDAMVSAMSLSEEGDYAALSECVRDAVLCAESCGAESLDQERELCLDLAGSDTARVELVEASRQRTIEILAHV